MGARAPKKNSALTQAFNGIKVVVGGGRSGTLQTVLGTTSKVHQKIPSRPPRTFIQERLKYIKFGAQAWTKGEESVHLRAQAHRLFLVGELVDIPLGISIISIWLKPYRARCSPSQIGRIRPIATEKTRATSAPDFVNKSIRIYQDPDMSDPKSECFKPPRKETMRGCLSRLADQESLNVDVNRLFSRGPKQFK